jgi:hypothetical protein
MPGVQSHWILYLCIYSDPHTPPPPNLECSMYMLKLVKKKRYWIGLIYICYNFTFDDFFLYNLMFFILQVWPCRLSRSWRVLNATSESWCCWLWFSVIKLHRIIKHKYYFKEITMISHGTSWSWTSTQQYL